MWKKLKNTDFDKTQHLKLWQNSKTLIVTKLKNSNCVKTKKKTQIVTKLKNTNCDKTQKLKLCQNSTTQRGTRYCWGWPQYWCKQYLHQYLFTFFLVDILLFHANGRILLVFMNFILLHQLKKEDNHTSARYLHMLDLCQHLLSQTKWS